MVTFEVAGELYPLDRDTAEWLAHGLRRLNLDGDPLPGKMLAAAIAIEHQLENDDERPIELTRLEAVQLERILDLEVSRSPDESLERLQRALEAQIRAEEN